MLWKESQYLLCKFWERQILAKIFGIQWGKKKDPVHHKMLDELVQGSVPLCLSAGPLKVFSFVHSENR